MPGMSLIPSESASFPDLVGHPHGFRHPKARRPSLKRTQKKAATVLHSRTEPNPVQQIPAAATAEDEFLAIAENQLEPLSINESEPEVSASQISSASEVATTQDELEPLATDESQQEIRASEASVACEVATTEDELELLATDESQQEVRASEVSATCEVAAAEDELEPLATDESEERVSASKISRSADVTTAEEELQSLISEEPAEHVSASNLSPALPAAPEPSLTARELLLPLIFDEPAEEGSASETLFEPLSPLSMTRTPHVNSIIARSEDEPSAASKQSAEQIPASKTAPPKAMAPVRVALPIPPRRSVAQMRSRIQPQEFTPPATSAANRPRTPARGLTIVRPRPAVPENRANGLFSRIPLLKLPRYRLFKLVRFIVCEAFAVGSLVLTLTFGLANGSANDSLSLLLKILAGVSAVAAIVVPVIFYGLPAALPRSDR
jgi:hypothetical protein